MISLAVTVFVAVYLGMALGRVPGLAIDRTGVAERAASAGTKPSFVDFARSGIIMTLAGMAVAVWWLWLVGAMPV